MEIKIEDAKPEETPKDETATPTKEGEEKKDGEGETKTEEEKPNEITDAERRKMENEKYPIIEEKSEATMEKLCNFIYAKDNTDRIRTRAILCHIYHHGLHDRWYEARDLMLMSHLQDNIEHSDIPTQVGYLDHHS